METRVAGAAMRGLVFLMLAGCSHVTFELPEAGAPRDVREKAYAEYRPVHVQGVKQLDAPKVKWIRSLQLANGEEVLEPEDLLPAVTPDSVTAQTVATYQQKNRAWRVLAPISGWTGVGGVTALTWFLAVSATHRGNGDALDTSARVALWTGLPLLGVALVSLIVAFIVVPDSEPERAAAFTSFDADLRTRLALDPAEAPP